MLVEKPECKRLFERHKCRWDHNIKIDLQNRVGTYGWILLALDRGQWRHLVNTINVLYDLYWIDRNYY